MRQTETVLQFLLPVFPVWWWNHPWTMFPWLNTPNNILSIFVLHEHGKQRRTNRDFNDWLRIYFFWPYCVHGINISFNIFINIVLLTFLCLCPWINLTLIWRTFSCLQMNYGLLILMVLQVHLVCLSVLCSASLSPAGHSRWLQLPEPSFAGGFFLLMEVAIPAALNQFTNQVQEKH